MLGGPIWHALRTHDACSLADLINKGEDVNADGTGDQRPIHMASELDDAASIKLLIEGGADFRCEDGQLRTPLLVACEFGSFTAARLLIELGASLTATDKSETTPLHWLAYFGSHELVELAISKGALVDAQNDSNETPLMHALMQGRWGVAQQLLERGADPRAIDSARCTPLHHALSQGGAVTHNCPEAAAVVERLIGIKENVDATDKEKRTPLHWASGKSLLQFVEMLLDAGAKVNAADWAEQTPLHWACAVNATESARALIKAGADPEKADRDSRSPLLCAADRASEGCLRLLLGQPNAKVDIVDWGGFSALHYSARRGALGCVRILLEKGADRLLAAASGQLPVEVAVGSEVQELLRADPPGLKRRRLSSATSLSLQGMLPELASAFYLACATGDITKVEQLCAPSVLSEAAATLAAMAKLGAMLDVQQMHTSTKTSTVAVELHTPSGTAVHMLTFDEDCMLAAIGTYAHAPP
jgi:ankyrin repeat protein